VHAVVANNQIAVNVELAAVFGGDAAQEKWGEEAGKDRETQRGTARQHALDKCRHNLVAEGCIH
jgi:hypothetical protein